MHGPHAARGVPPARPHHAGPAFLLLLRDGVGAAQQLRAPRLERAIGVVYRPDTERMSHYFQARLAEQFDALIHIDTTRAVAPLEHAAPEQSGDAPETFPTGE